MRVRIFETGIDRDTLLNVPDQLYRNSAFVTLDGVLLLREKQIHWQGRPPADDRLLISFAQMTTQEGREYPCWLPESLVDYELHEVPEPHRIPVKRPDGKIIDTDAPEYGAGAFTIPRWLAGQLEALTAYALLERRHERAAREAEKKLEQRNQVRRMAKARAAAQKKSRQGQGELFGVAR